MELLRRMGSALGRRGIPEGMHDRVPAGQYVTPKMPVMSLGSTPQIERDEWRLRITGLVAEPQELDWERFLALGDAPEIADFHCVTQWTRLNVAWDGVPASTVLDLVTPSPEARYVMVHCADEYTTNIELAALREPDVLFAHTQDGEPLTPQHGFPVRLVVPARYGWKSAKWVTEIEFMDKNRPGFWEVMGYHMRGDPWREERFEAAGQAPAAP